MLDITQVGLHRPLKIASLSAVLAALIALGVICIGIREFLYPAVAATGFGVQLFDSRDADFLAIKAARDVTSAILVLIVLALRNRRLLACTSGALTLIPIFDGLIVLRHAAWSFTPFLLVHWITALVMLLIVVLLRSGK
jgi:hypothetical protein